MATETEQLVVELEARINNFEKSFAKASGTANEHWTKIEARGRQAGNRMQSDIAKASSGITDSLKGIGGTIASGFGIGTLSLGAFFSMAVKINGELAKLSGLAKRAGVSTDTIQEVKFAANIKGVSDDDFAASMKTSLGLLDEAQRQVNSLQRLFNANGLAIKNSNGQLIAFDQLLERAATLMVNARTEQERIKIAEMIGLSSDWVAVLRNGPAAFRASAEAAHSAGAVIDKDVIAKAKEFDRAWTEATVRFKAGLTEALTDLGGAFGDFWNDVLDSVPGANFIAEKFNRMFGGLSHMTIPELEAAVARSIANGTKAEVERIQGEIDRRNGKQPLRLTVNKPDPAAGGNATVIPKDGAEKNAFDRAVFEANKRIAQTEAETRSIGLNSEARERAKLVAELEEAAKKANTEAGFRNVGVTDQQREKINRLADAMASAARGQRLAQQNFEAFNEALKFSGNMAVDFFDSLGDKAKSFADVVSSATALAKRAILQALIVGDGPLAGIFGTKSSVSGGPGGIFGWLGTMLGSGKAEGGLVRGPGTGTSDSILTPISDGEFVVRASETKKHRALLERINAGSLKGFKDGGIVGPSPSIVPALPDMNIAGPIGGQTINISPTINTTVEGGSRGPQADAELASAIGKQVEGAVRALVSKEIRTQMKPGGLLKR